MSVVVIKKQRAIISPSPSPDSDDTDNVASVAINTPQHLCGATAPVGVALSRGALTILLTGI